ncbi:MAG: EF-P lysine aminoacylase GenX [Gammaproteobacteria bacterium]|nr:EF-P lysine aminoacylase GenX [Gammaproteobacteria bacterium]
MMSQAWQPTASLATLKKRGAILDAIRQFFQQRQVLEVETPLLSATTVTDPHIESIKTDSGYLQTSPEFAMKRLLAAGSGAIFQISKAFRHEERGNQHQREFTMLEWYRPGLNHHQLMDEIDQLLQQLFAFAPAQRLSYQALFQHHLKINPHQTDSQTLATIAQQHNIDAVNITSRDDWLNILFTHCIEPTLQQPTFIYDYPASQSALAKIDNGVAQRFELYINGIELANGFHELTDAAEQAARFEQDRQQRQIAHQCDIAVDQSLLAALAHGLPDCAGVALGIDRLIMVACHLNDIRQTISFAD